MEMVMDETGNPDIIMAGAIAPSTVLAIERIKILEKIGYRRFVATTPFYIRPKNAEELRRHFFILANATSMEMVIYNIPQCTGISVPEALIKELSLQKATKDCKDSSGDNARFERLCHQNDVTGLRMYEGLQPNFKRLHQIGAYGCVPVPANVFPSLFSMAWNSPSTGAQSKADEIWNILVKDNDYISATLYALSLIGIGREHIISPYTGSDEGTKHNVTKLISKYF